MKKNITTKTKIFRDFKTQSGIRVTFKKRENDIHHLFDLKIKRIKQIKILKKEFDILRKQIWDISVLNKLKKEQIMKKEKILCECRKK